MQYKLKIKNEFYKRKWYIKHELKLTVIKSIQQNLSIDPITRISTQHQIQKFKRRGVLSKHNKICMLTGKRRGIHPFFFLSRHMLKRLGTLNELQNIKVNSW